MAVDALGKVKAFLSSGIQASIKYQLNLGVNLRIRTHLDLCLESLSWVPLSEMYTFFRFVGTHTSLDMLLLNRRLQPNLVLAPSNYMSPMGKHTHSILPSH